MRPTAERFRWLWRGVAASLLLLLLAVLAVPIAAAQGDGDASLPACCRAAGAHGCSMRMHHAATHHDDHSRELAAFTERCPCPPFAPSVVTSHDEAPMAASLWMAVAIPARASPRDGPAAHSSDVFASDGDPRGPPSTLLA